MTVLQSFDARTGQPIDAPAGHPLIATTPAQLDAGARRRRAPAWAASDGAARARLLDALAAALEARRDELVALADAETALGAGRLQGELTARRSSCGASAAWRARACRSGTWTTPPWPARRRPGIRP
jgi:NADP-dependent aldehyde dehydrogenase